MPDFQTLLHDKEITIFAPFQDQGAYTLLPTALEIARRDDGTEDFHLGIVRPENPMLPPKPHGMLDFRLQAGFPMEEGLALVRKSKSGAVLEQAVFRDGYVQMFPIKEFKGASQQLLSPVPINFQGLGVARFFFDMDIDSAMLVKDMLTANTAPMRAEAHLEVWGVAPRLPLQVTLDPSAFLQYLRSKARPDGLISRGDLVSAFSNARADVPWTVQGTIDDNARMTFGDCMADHVRSRFAKLALPPQGESSPLLSLPKPDQFGTGTFAWDLNEPTPTARLVSLRFDPLAAARDLVASHGIDAVVSMDTVRKLQTGIVSLSIAANLPAQRQGVLSLGVTVKMPPKMPYRPQQINRTVELQEPRDSGSVQVQLSPKEKLSYLYQTFVILQDPASGIRRLEGVDTHGEGEKLTLNIDDFPVSFVPVEASDRLLSAGAVSGTLRYDDVQNPFSLTASQPRMALAVPKDSSATLEFEFQSLDKAHVVRLGPAPARAVHLDLSSFREYGPQALDIRCEFHEGTPLLAIDLLPEAMPETASNITVMALTPQSPQKQWTWFSSSPFTAGYRYRIHSNGTAANPWSDVRSPFEPLLLDSATAVQAAGAGGKS
jgi:hypothetical protein